MKKISIRPEREYLREIIKKMENGLYVIPAFQRDFVWLQRQIIVLFDSIIKGYPIGTLILWKPSGESYRIKNVVNDNIYADNNKHVYILDGRQRLTAFYCCVLDYENKPGKFNLYFNLEKESFEFQNNKLDYDKSVLVSEVYDTFRMLGILQQFMEIEDVEKRNDYIKKVKELNTILQSYEIGEIELDDCSLDEAGEVFSRINSKGTDISKVEMLQAVSYKSPDNVLFAEEIKSIINSLEEFNFSDIRTDDLLNCCYRYINKYFFEDTNLKLLTGADLNDIVIRLRTDIHKTVDFLYNECNVLSYRHLPYTRQLIAICSFFSEVKDPSNAQLFELKKWFYYTTANQSFQNSSLGNVRPLFYRFNKFLRGEVDTAIDYDVVELNSTMDFKYSNSSALSNLIFMCTIEHAKKTCNMQDIQYLGDYKYSKSKPSTTFIMLKEDDRRQLNLLLNQKKRVLAMPHILLDDDMIGAYLSGQEDVLEKLRRNMIIDNLCSCLQSLGIEYCLDYTNGIDNIISEFLELNTEEKAEFCRALKDTYYESLIFNLKLTHSGKFVLASQQLHDKYIISREDIQQLLKIISDKYCNQEDPLDYFELMATLERNED